VIQNSIVSQFKWSFCLIGAMNENLMNIYGIMSKDHKYKTMSKQKAAPMSKKTEIIVYGIKCTIVGL
jgi:hypothetical protein